MNKKIKSVSAFIIAVIMMFSFAACADRNIEEIKNTAEAFCSDYDKFKYKDAMDYLDGSDDSYELANINGVSDFEDVIVDSMGIDKSSMEDMGMSKDFFESFAKKIIKMLSVRHNITNIEKKNNDTYAVSVDFKISSPDFDIDFDSSKYQDEIEDYLINKCGLNDSSTEEEAMKYVPDAVEHVFDIIIKDMKDSISEEVQSGTLIFVKKDGKWVISASESEIGSDSIEEKYGESNIFND